MIGKMLGWTVRTAAAALALATAAYPQEPTPTPPPAPLSYPSPAPLPATDDTRPVLPLSLDEAVARALEHNVDIAVNRYDPQDAAEAVRELKGFYDPLLTSLISRSSATRPASDFFSGAPEVETDVDIYNFGVIQQVPTGGSFRADFNNNKTTTNSAFSIFNPSNSSNLNLRASQPLLRDFKIDSTRFQIKVAKRNQDISDVQFRQTVVNTVAGVKQLYYDLIYAIDNLEAQRKSLALARKLLDENQIKVRVGTMAPLDVVAAESEVAGREESVIVAEQALLDAEDDVRRSIFADNAAQNWTYRIVPSDRPTADPTPVDAEAAVRNALEKRTDVVAARLNLENAVDNVRFAKNQTLPAVDLQAAYGSVGQAGVQVRDAQGDLLPVPIPGGFGNAFGDVFGFDFPTWTLGVQFSYPIPNRSARAASARARIGRDRQETSLRRLEIAVTQEVRSAARAVDSNFKRVGSTRAARVLQERRLDAEEKRFAAGMSTNFLVTQAQRDLALAEVSELRAVADYRKSLVNFERVQEAGGGVLFSSTPSAVTAVTNNPTQ
jgi:outer membrane protein TolC